MLSLLGRASRASLWWSRGSAEGHPRPAACVWTAVNMGTGLRAPVWRAWVQDSASDSEQGKVRSLSGGRMARCWPCLCKIPGRPLLPAISVQLLPQLLL